VKFNFSLQEYLRNFLQRNQHTDEIIKATIIQGYDIDQHFLPNSG